MIVVAVVGGVIVGGLLVLAVVILVAKICPLGRKPERYGHRHSASLSDTLANGFETAKHTCSTVLLLQPA